jgi:23S rRNA (uracil1939-C5)-methyltransferase
MKPQQNFTATITELSHEGRGIAHVDGKITFITGALPTETVEATYTHRRKNLDEARVVEILEPSNLRSTPACAHFGICGGCSMQHMQAELQVQYKQGVLLNHLQHFGQVTPDTLLPPLVGDSYGYRRKARLGVRYVRKKQRLLVGFREINGRYLADVEACEVLDPRIGHKLIALRELIEKLPHYDHIPQVEVAAGDTDIALVLRHMVALTDDEIQQFCDFAALHNFHLYLQPGGTDTIHKIWPRDNRERLSYHLTTGNVELLFHPADFTQVNVSINQQMVAHAIELLALTSNDRVLDLFCGLGNFTLPLARFCKQVTGVEGDAKMVERGYENAAHNNLTNVEFYSADLFSDFTHLPWFKPVYDKILLDPPRSGAEAIIRQLPALNVNTIVYVSCNPATLARDAGIMVAHGYRLSKAGVMDMFPHTSHVESIALFEKVK